MGGSEGPENVGRITADDIDKAVIRVHAKMAAAERQRYGRKDRIHDREPWLNLIFLIWFVAWGSAFLGAGNLLGILMLVVGVAFGAVGAWGVRWRWKADIAWRDIPR